MEDRAKSVGADIRGGQPTGGNIKGGLTTIEEESLGAIAKAGNSPIEAVYGYGIPLEVKGLVVMDSPGRESEILTGLAAAGCSIIAFTTGRGAPQGFPFVSVVKITGNENTWNKLRDHMDIDVKGPVI
jgi:altronate dehydratase large subunit